jgi:hypothetical protein
MGGLGWKELIGSGGVLLASIIAQIVTVALLFANNRMAYKRSRREKLWDLKREVYSKVIAKVSEILDAYSQAIAIYSTSGADESAKKIASQNEHIVFQKILQAQDLFRDNYLIFSRAFLRRFQSINGIEALDLCNYPGPESYDVILAERKRWLSELHESLVEQARKELETGD